MPAQVQDLIHETSTSTGTGNLTVAAVNGKVRISDATHGFGTGDDGADNPVLYISNRSAAEWEVCPGYMSDANTLVRGTPIKSSNANAAVNFSAGIKDITCDIPASKQVDTDRTQTLSNKTLDGASLPVTYSDDGAGEGPVANLLRNSASPAASDIIGALALQGKDSGGNTDTYAKLFAQIVDATSGSEDGLLGFQTAIAGALASRLLLGHGLYTPGVTGGDKGANSANFAVIYQANIPVLTSIALQVFTSDGTYTPTTGMKFCLVISTGGGGGGGGCDSDGSSNAGAAGGAGAGTCISIFTAATIGANQAVVVGIGGPGGAVTGGNGTAGEDTTFGSLHTATGGPAGVGVAATGSNQGAAGISGATPTGGQLNIKGGDSGWGTGFGTTANTAISGYGGGSFWGGGGTGARQIGAGRATGGAGGPYGSGGGGGVNINTAAGIAGAAGADGVVMVLEFI